MRARSGLFTGSTRRFYVTDGTATGLSSVPLWSLQSTNRHELRGTRFFRALPQNFPYFEFSLQFVLQNAGLAIPPKCAKLREILGVRGSSVGVRDSPVNRRVVGSNPTRGAATTHV